MVVVAMTTDQAHAAEVDRIKAANLGHGYVYERADGKRGALHSAGADKQPVDCGGPARCSACRADWRHRYGVAWPEGALA
jgi:hypothetical protein